MKVAEGLVRPRTQLGRWMKKNNKTLSDLVRGACISQPTARSYVDGEPHTRWDHDVLQRISAFTGGTVSVEALKSAKGAA